MRVLGHSHWLHPLQVIHNSKPVESEAASWKMVDTFNTETIGPSVCDLMDGITLEGNVILATKNCPYATHFSVNILKLPFSYAFQLCLSVALKTQMMSNSWCQN